MINGCVKGKSNIIKRRATKRNSCSKLSSSIAHSLAHSLSGSKRGGSLRARSLRGSRGPRCSWRPRTLLCFSGLAKGLPALRRRVDRRKSGEWLRGGREKASPSTLGVSKAARRRQFGSMTDNRESYSDRPLGFGCNLPLPRQALLKVHTLRRSRRRPTYVASVIVLRCVTLKPALDNIPCNSSAVQRCASSQRGETSAVIMVTCFRS